MSTFWDCVHLALLVPGFVVGLCISTISDYLWYRRLLGGKWYLVRFFMLTGDVYQWVREPGFGEVLEVEDHG